MVQGKRPNTSLLWAARLTTEGSRMIFITEARRYPRARLAGNTVSSTGRLH